MRAVMNVGRIAIVCLVLFLCPSWAQAVVYWTDDFENHLYPNWIPAFTACINVGSQDGATCYPRISSTLANSPTQSLWSHYTDANLAGQAGPAAGTYYDRYLNASGSLSTPELWFRFYYRTVAFTYANPTNKHFFFIGGSGSGGPDPYVVLQNYGGSRSMSFQTENGFLHTCPNGTTDLSCNFFNNTATVPLNDNQWYCIEGRLKVNTVGASDGIMELYVNGVQTHNYTNVVYRTSSGQWNFTRHYAQYGSGERYIDDLSLANARIGGAGCTSGSADTTPPGIPTLTASASGGGQGNASWLAVTDNVGVTGYELLRCTGGACTPTTVVATTTPTTLFYTDTSVASSTTYRYGVRAFDSAGNRSNLSNIVSVTTTATFRNTLASVTHDVANNTDIGAAFDAGYTGQGPCQIVSNRVRSTTVNTRCYETYNGVTPSNDQWSQRTISTLTGAQLADQCALIRASNAATVTSYAGCAQINGSNTFEIRKYVTGTPTVLSGNATYTPTAGDKIRLEAESTTLRLYLIRGTQEILVTSLTDASIASGKAGLTNFVATGGSLANNESDDFVIGDFGAAAGGAITFDAVSSSANSNTTNSISWTHTTGTCNNRVLVVGTQARDDANQTDTAVTGVTYQGFPLTSIRSDQVLNGAGDIRTSLWYLVNPGAGSGTVQITWSSALSRVGVGSAISLCGVDQAAALDANNGSTATSGTTASTSITTVANNAWIIDNTAGRPGNTITVGANQTERVNRGGLDGSSVQAITIGMSTVDGKAVAGAETMDWTKSDGHWAISSASFKTAAVTPVVPPTIASLTLSVSGATLTAGATTPTRMRIAAGNNAGTLSFADNVAWSTTYTKTWPDGYEYACFFPIDSAGVENTNSTAYQCRSLVGIVQPLDTTPIVMTQTSPSGTLNQGTTSWVFSIALSKSGQCNWDTSNTTYDLMANTMTTASLSASASTGAILSNGTTTHVFTQCRFSNSAGQPITTTTALDIPISVASGAPTDTTKPSTIADLAATALTQAQVFLIWTAATDANGIVSYNIYLCPTTGTSCTPDTLAGSTGNVTQTVLNLSPLTRYCFDVRAVDPSNNEALASNVVCGTTTAIPDITPPSTMQNLRIVGGPFASSVILGWDQGDGTPGPVTSTIEQCTGAGCSDFTVVQSNITTQQLQTNLTAGVLYRFRGIFTDLASNRSLAYSNIVDALTTTSGIGVPRGTFPFGSTRDTVPSPRPVRP